MGTRRPGASRRPERRAGRARPGGVVAKPPRPGRRRTSLGGAGTRRRARVAGRRHPDRADRRPTGRGVALGRPPRGGAAAGCGETRIAARVVRVAEVSDGRVVDLWVRVGGVDLAEHPIAITVEADGVVAPVEPGVDRTADRWAGRAVPVRGRRSGAGDGARPHAAGSGSTPGRRRARERRRRPRRRAARTRPAPSPSSRTSRWTATGSSSSSTGPPTGCGCAGPGPTSPGEAAARRHGRLRHPARSLRPPGVAGDRGLPPAPPRGPRRRGRPGASGCRSRSSATATGSGCCRPATGPARSTSARPRADDELGAYGQERLRASYAVDERRDRPGPVVLRELRRPLGDRHPAGGLRGAAPSAARARAGRGGSSTTATGPRRGRGRS